MTSPTSGMGSFTGGMTSIDAPMSTPGTTTPASQPTPATPDPGMSSAAKGAAAASIISALAGAYSTYQTGKIVKKMGKFNRAMAEWRARDAMQRGHESEYLSRRRIKKTIGGQRAAYAAQGIRVDTGSARDVQFETHNIGEIDAMNIKINAIREAYGHRMAGLGFDYKGSMALAQSKAKSVDTLLAGGMKSASFFKKG